jgi:cell division protease FtsH
MSDRVGPMAWSSQQHVFLGEDIMTSGREYSDDTAKLVDEEVARILTDQEQRATELLSKHRRGLALVAEALIEHETIDGREVARLIQQGLTESGDTEEVKLNISVVDDINDDVTVEAPADPAPARSTLRETPKIVPRPAAGA